MGLFGADAFSPDAIMNAANIINGGGSEDPTDQMKKRQRQAMQGPDLGAQLKSLFYHIMGQPYGGNSPVTLGTAQPLAQMQGPNLMSYFGG